MPRNFEEIEALLDDESPAYLKEYQVGTGLKHMRRKMKERRPFKFKSVSAHKAALKRWRKYGARIIKGIIKSRQSAKGKQLTKALAKHLKFRNNQKALTASVESVMMTLPEELRKDAISLFPFLSQLVEMTEFISDISVAMSDECEDIIREQSIQSKLYDYLDTEEKEISDLNESELAQIIDGREEVDTLFLEYQSNAPHLLYTLSAEVPGSYPVGYRPSVNPLDYVTYYGGSTDKGNCQICKKEYEYAVYWGDPYFCRAHGGNTLEQEPECKHIPEEEREEPMPIKRRIHAGNSIAARIARGG